MSWKEASRINSNLKTPLDILINNLIGKTNSAPGSVNNGNIHSKLNALINNTAGSTTASGTGNLSQKLQELLNRMTTTRCGYLDTKISSRLATTDANTHYSNLMKRLQEEAGFANTTMVPFDGFISRHTTSWTYSNSKGGVLKGVIYGVDPDRPSDALDFRMTLTVDGVNIITDSYIFEYVYRSHDHGGNTHNSRTNYFELEIPFRSSVKFSTKDDFNYTQGTELYYSGFAYINRV